jgi:hypothetical protein
MGIHKMDLQVDLVGADFLTQWAAQNGLRFYAVLGHHMGGYALLINAAVFTIRAGIYLGGVLVAAGFCS